MTAAFKGVFPPVPTIVNEQGELDRLHGPYAGSCNS